MNWKGCVKKQSWPILRYYPDGCVEGLRITTTPPPRPPVEIRKLNLGTPVTMQKHSLDLYE
jgi:hypothetical protein